MMLYEEKQENFEIKISTKKENPKMVIKINSKNKV